MHLNAKNVGVMVLGDVRDKIFLDDVLKGFGFRSYSIKMHPAVAVASPLAALMF
jgi:hypothetical protein